MGDWPYAVMTRAGALYEHLANAACAGCGERFEFDDRCYADYDHIWHSGCWPKVLSEHPGSSPHPETDARAEQENE